MTIEQIDSSKVLITLCSDDMDDYRLKYDTIGFENPHSRKILKRLLNLACAKTGLSAQNKRLLMETLPCKSGCIILVTFMEKQKTPKKYRIKGHGENYCYCFAELEELIKAVTLIYSQSLCVPSASTYLYGAKYYLVFEPYPLPIQAKRILSEYGRQKRFGRAFAASLKEAAHTVCPRNSVRLMGKAFAK